MKEDDDMNNLDWTMLTKRFYDFMFEARKYDFYTPELDKMEDSLFKMRPYKGDEKHGLQK